MSPYWHAVTVIALSALAFSAATLFVVGLTADKDDDVTAGLVVMVIAFVLLLAGAVTV